MKGSKRRKEAKFVGFLKVKNGIVEHADENAIALLKFRKLIVGQPFSFLFPKYKLPRICEKPYCKVIKLNSKKLLVASVLLPSPLEYFLVLVGPTEQLIPVFEKPESLFKIHPKIIPLFESIVDDIVISDGDGVILYISPTFKELYGVAEEEVLGKTVFEVEEKKIVSPSVSTIALKKRKKVTIVQENREGRKFVVTAVPVLNEENKIQGVISYNRDVHEYLELKERYKKLENKVIRFSSEIRELRQKEMRFPNIIAKSVQMKNVLNLSIKVAAVDINLIITGESGVGKNLIAKFIHNHSARKKGPFIEISCGAIPETLLESELFGYEPGSFTGARKEGKTGMIELAEKGTLLLDEIGELPLQLQVKLLKVLQEKKLTKIGGIEPVKINFRLIAATNRDLVKLVKEGLFREDLYYRLNVVPIKIPPLRERQGDLLLLITHFLERSNQHYQKQKTLSSQAMDILLKYEWPGNVRELENLVERIVITSDQEHIYADELPNEIKSLPWISSSEGITLPRAREILEKQMVQKAYDRLKTTIGVAKALGISPASASRKIKKHIVSVQE